MQELEIWRTALSRHRAIVSAGVGYEDGSLKSAL
jgi:hypothetical protein